MRTSWGHVSRETFSPIGSFIVTCYRISPYVKWLISQSDGIYSGIIFPIVTYLYPTRQSERVSFMCSIMRWILWLMNLLALSRSESFCWDVLTKCQRNFPCALKLNALFTRQCKKALGFRYDPKYYGSYPKITGSMEPKCPSKCVQAIKDLTSLPKGKAVESCVCKDGDGVCLTIIARLKRCVNGSDKNDTVFSCTAARVRCNKDKNCQTNQYNFLKRCSQLISGVECSQDCKESQKELLGSKRGSALLECDCDGREEPYCRGIRSNYENLCKPKTRKTRDPDFPTVPQRSYFGNSGPNSQFGFPMWILNTAIIAHVFVLYHW